MTHIHTHVRAHSMPPDRHLATMLTAASASFRCGFAPLDILFRGVTDDPHFITEAPLRCRFEKGDLVPRVAIPLTQFAASEHVCIISLGSVKSQFEYSHGSQMQIRSLIKKKKKKKTGLFFLLFLFFRPGLW